MKNIKTNLKLIKSYIECGDIKTFSFEPNNLSWQPGQYQAYRLIQAGMDEKDNLRYFTIASAPSEKRIDISTRMTASAFKNTLDILETGDTIEASNLGGDFLWDKDVKEPIILIAAGVGVTPYRSMLIERLKNNQKINAQLIYFNRNSEIAFLDTFTTISKLHPEFNFMPIVGEHVSSERILELAPQAKEGTVYLSGPEAMVEKIGKEFKEININIKQDWFPGYTNDNF